jgi:hypothetical protein
MRKLITTIAAAGVLGMAAMSTSTAAPVAGYEGLYSTVFASCTIPAGTVPTCETAINAYAGALASAVDLEVANASFIALRSEVFAANAADEGFQAEIDALFELLLPDSGALGNAASPL